MAYIEIFCLLLFVTFIFHLIKRPRIGENEPPLVPYQFPIIGHTYYFLYDAENFLKECKEKFGEPFSLYVFGSVITIVGVESTPEWFVNNSLVNLVSTHQEFKKKFYSELKSFLAIVLRNIQNTLSLIIAKPVANVLLGEECAQFEEIITSFAVIENEVMFIPPCLSFIHPSLHKYFVLYCDQSITFVLPFKFGWNPMIKHRNLFVQHCKPIIEKRIRQRRELGEKYIQKAKMDVVDDEFLDNLFGELYFLVFASINQTTHSLSMALFDYGGRPELWKEIYEEQLKINNGTNIDLNTKDVDKMIKLECFLKESFRYSTAIGNYTLTFNLSYSTKSIMQ
ncbi:44761_t:CDS:2, partial [Gigaspora margarita]